jgi:hypothetical protein
MNVIIGGNMGYASEQFCHDCVVYCAHHYTTERVRFGPASERRTNVSTNHEIVAVPLERVL